MAGRPGQFRLPPGLERDFLEKLLHAARVRVREYMNAVDVSQTLALSLTTEIVSDFFRADLRGRLILPYYWAEFVHNGRGPGQAHKKFILFFPNKADDPRTTGGLAYPKQLGDRRTLSRADFKRLDKINRERKKRNERPIMIFAKSVAPVAPKKFYVNALRIFPVVPAIENRLAEIVKKIAPNGRRVIRFRLG